MEPLNALVWFAVAVMVIVVTLALVRLLFREFERRNKQKSEDYRLDIESVGRDFDTRFNSCMVEYVRHQSTLTDQLYLDLDGLLSDIRERITKINARTIDLLPDDYKIVVEHRRKWREYDWAISRLIKVNTE